MKSEIERLEAGINFLTDLYSEPGFLLVNYTVRRRLRDILGRELSNRTIDREPGRRIQMNEVYAFKGSHWT